MLLFIELSIYNISIAQHFAPAYPHFQKAQKNAIFGTQNAKNAPKEFLPPGLCAHFTYSLECTTPHLKWISM